MEMCFTVWKAGEMSWYNFDGGKVRTNAKEGLGGSDYIFTKAGVMATGWVYDDDGTWQAIDWETPEEQIQGYQEDVTKFYYARNLLNYGFEGIHYKKVPLTDEEKKAVEGKPYVFDFKIHLDKEKRKDYAVPYWVQGGLFNTYVLDTEPADKWSTFKEFNDSAKAALSFGFDFNTEPVSTQVASFLNIRDEFGRSLYTGSVDPDEYVP